MTVKTSASAANSSAAEALRLVASDWNLPVVDEGVEVEEVEVVRVGTEVVGEDGEGVRVAVDEGEGELGKGEVGGGRVVGAGVVEAGGVDEGRGGAVAVHEAGRLHRLRSTMR